MTGCGVRERVGLFVILDIAIYSKIRKKSLLRVLDRRKDLGPKGRLGPHEEVLRAAARPLVGENGEEIVGRFELRGEDDVALAPLAHQLPEPRMVKRLVLVDAVRLGAVVV